MIRRGELHGCSVIVIDEAHERSLNIDLILALARRELIALPQLRLLVVSATIEADAFVGFFQPELTATSLPLPGKAGKPVYERWRASPPLPVSLAGARMPGEVAHTATNIAVDRLRRAPSGHSGRRPHLRRRHPCFPARKARNPGCHR